MDFEIKNLDLSNVIVREMYRTSKDKRVLSKALGMTKSRIKKISRRPHRVPLCELSKLVDELCAGSDFRDLCEMQLCMFSVNPNQRSV